MLEILSQIKRDISSLDRKAVAALVYTAIGLSCIYYLKDQTAIAAIVSSTPLAAFGQWITFSADNNLRTLTWWALVVLFFYHVIPILIIKLIWKEKLSDYGLKPQTDHGFVKLLAACVLIMLPLVYLLSLTAGFSAKYPFMQIYNGEAYIGQTLLVWELIYFLQFFGLEFFFRGFLVNSLKPSLGLYSIFVMTVPYTMIHFGKPPAETFAAIIAGIFLGWLSYRNGSIWLGLILHCAVAFSMDVFALYGKGLLF